MLTKENFRKEVLLLRTQYRNDNKWVESWRKWNDDTIMDSYINAAYNMYRATANNKLKLTVLGDTEIRSISELIRNFGLMSASGVQEKRDARMVNDVDQFRKQVAMGTAAGLKDVTKVMGVGSILSDKMWTPMLNDALMIGSIEGKQDFYLGLNTQEQLAWSRLGFNSDVASKAAMFGGSIKSKRNAYQSQWNTFFLKQPQMIWNGAIPRVFARELLALKFFGYKPIYSKLGLAFAPHAVSSIGTPRLTNYTRTLRSVGFFDNNKVSVMREISEFLFNDGKALC